MSRTKAPIVRAVHPVADLFPMLADDELAELAEDIRQRGLLQPIVLDPSGAILDGRNRLAACEIAGVEPAFVTYDGDDPDGYALAVNIARRHLTTGARAVIAAKAYRAGAGTQEKIAGCTNLYNRPRISEAKIVLDWAPDLADAVIAGAQPLSRALETARERKAEAEALKSKMDRLRADALDLATLVDEERMNADDAVAALDAREAKVRQDEAERDEAARQQAAALASEQERQAEIEQDRRRRLSSGFGTNLVGLMSVLDPDPVGFLSRTWDPYANPHRELPNVRDFFSAKAVRRLSDHLSALADHLDEEGSDLL
jgi:ParB-like chromosome segregation protein Spo0J